MKEYRLTSQGRSIATVLARSAADAVSAVFGLTGPRGGVDVRAYLVTGSPRGGTS